MDALLAFLVVYLFAAKGADLAIKWKGDPGAFVNPGGWRFPVGEVFPFVGVVLGLLLMAGVGTIIS